MLVRKQAFDRTVCFDEWRLDDDVAEVFGDTQIALKQVLGVRIKTWTGFMPQVQDSPGIRSG